MLRLAFTAAALILLGACSQAEDSGNPAPTGETSSSSSSSTSSGTGGSGGASTGTGGATLAPCDDAGTCGDYVNGCTGCAVSTTCAEHYEGCFGDETCLDFNKCLAACKDDLACRDKCAESNPVGADRYGALVACIVCDACPNSCADFTDFCL
ncbi:MAG: hypothetical protein IPM54_39895 [Polyangiaceae bacterium]|nr:hypothetical protein [Polyangiaceae bacterium]